ncbi:hypothetical protein OOK31_33415 [Streptomyces sp. NBC_00249]|uniref:hypothetical protein n=1 Tax=Streptomyces sp. NBC_00249 TaxID=2975690 RepID=UPI002257BE7D|nr:hypothetical protein [Streptomyces sp. NBC_00249]MCX5198729.1 hypothetical protein [Streptomyces sp. NBC_00249]
MNTSTAPAFPPATTERPVPRWALTVARLLPLLALPVCLWRLPIGFGFQMGMDVPPAPQPLWVTVPYVLTLSLLSEAFALLCAGLVRPWGEVVSRRVPVLRGRRIPPYAVTVPAALAGLALTLLTVDWVLSTFGIAGFHTVGWTSPGWQLLAATVSGLFALWGPLILALTYAYHRRRTTR